MKERSIPDNINGIVWTAMRSMMTDTAKASEHIEDIKRITANMNLNQRKHAAWDIRQNIEWNTNGFAAGYACAFSSTAPEWESLALWLESGHPYKKREPLPKNRISSVWLRFILYSLRYICHSRSYSVSYVWDIVLLFPLMEECQKRQIEKWMSENVMDTDDWEIHKFAAAVDANNRYSVSASATDKEQKDWVTRHNATVIHNGVFQDIAATYTCFLFDGEYYDAETYFKNPHRCGSLIPEFIKSIKHIEQ